MFVALDEAGRVCVSTRDTALKTAHLRRAAMRSEQRVLVRMTIERAGPRQSG